MRLRVVQACLTLACALLLVAGITTLSVLSAVHAAAVSHSSASAGGTPPGGESFSLAGQPGSSQTAPRTPAPQISHNLVFIGDSLTEGAYADTQAGAFAWKVPADLHMTSIVTSALYGSTALLTAQSMAAKKVLGIPGDARFVIIELGTNDVGATNETQAQFRSAYDYILTRIAGVAPAAHFICLSVWRSGINGQPNSGYAHNQIISDECAKFGGSYVVISDLFTIAADKGPAGRTTWLNGGLTDDFHPNSRGHAAIAARIEAVILA